MALSRQSVVVARRLIVRGKDPKSNTHEASVQAGATKFRKNKGKGKEESDVVRGQAAHDRLLEEWRRFAAVLNPPLARPPRSKEELLEAKQMVRDYSRNTLVRDKIFTREETKRLRLRQLAIEELPKELQAPALEMDLAPFPPHFILTQRIPPHEHENIFGNYQKPGQRLSISEKGAAPAIPYIAKTDY